MLTIDEALKLIQADINDDTVEWNSPLGKAYKLSFEALKRLQQHRTERIDITYCALPGETEE